jgi:prepilin-type N-terminal cleavage/methylation domain-containing protein
MIQILRNTRGFSLVEMIIVMGLFVVIIAITGESFNRIITQAFSQTKTAESNISGIVGLEMMRVDTESSGYGLLWSFQNAFVYNEAADAPGVNLNDNGRVYSDVNQNNVPRAVMSLNNVVSADPTVLLTGTDVLAIRSMSVATNTPARLWTYVESMVLPTGNPAPAPYMWSSDNLAPGNRVVMIQPVANMKPANALVVNPGSSTWTATFANYSTIGKPPSYNDAEKKSDAYIIYGVNDSVALRMPFNRADYYVRRPATTEQGWFRLPQRCNPSTGVLLKGVVGHASGNYQELPLLECVLDLQVVYGIITPGSSVLTDDDGTILSTLTPSDIRQQLKEIKIYILTHDGGIDRTYTYPNATIGVGPGNGITSGTGRTYDFAANGVANWQNYRWRVYQIVARPHNLAGGQ